MPDIEIKYPINFEINILEIDNVLPSLKIEMKVFNRGLFGNYQVTFNVWVSCNSWDDFINKTSCELKDLNDNSIIYIKNDKDFLIIIYSIIKIGNSVFSSKFQAKLQKEDVDSIINKFKEYSKWW